MEWERGRKVPSTVSGKKMKATYKKIGCHFEDTAFELGIKE